MTLSSVFIALGANLPHPEHGGPVETCEAALVALGSRGLRIVRRSRWYRSAPVPMSDQPWFVNGVAAVESDLDPVALLALLHAVEADFGRVRGVANAARTLDLDLLDHRGTVREGPDGPLLPHPRLHERAFVLLPLADVAADWVHPSSGARLADLIAALPKDQAIEPVET